MNSRIVIVGAVTLIAIVVGLAVSAVHKRRALIFCAGRRFFLRTESGLDLAIIRISVFGATALMFPPTTLLGGGHANPHAHEGTAWLAALITSIDPDAIEWLVVGFWCACVSSTLGLFTRVSTIAATASGLVAMGLPQLAGKVSHYHYLLWFMALLATCPCGTRLALDQLNGRRQRYQGRVQACVRPWMWIILAQFYFSAGIWKLLGGGKAWFSTENLQNILYRKWVELGDWTPFFRIDRYQLVLIGSGITVVVFELTFIVLIWTAPTRRLAASAGIVFHWMTFASMRIMFLSLQVCYSCFVDWESTWHRIRGRLGAIRKRAEDPADLSPAPRDHPGWFGTMAVGSAIFMGNLVSCAVNVHGWPFSPAPNFASLVPDVHHSVEFETVSEVGSRFVVANELRSSIGPAVFGETARRLASKPDGPDRDLECVRAIVLARAGSRELSQAPEVALWLTAKVVDASYPPSRTRGRQRLCSLRRSEVAGHTPQAPP